MSRADLEMISRVRSGKFAEKSIANAEDEWDFDILNPDHRTSYQSDKYLPKRRFVESKWERLRISKYINAMKKGWMKTPDEVAKEKKR